MTHPEEQGMDRAGRAAMRASDAVAVIIAAKDAAAFIARAVASALDQPQAAEVVLVDDGSRDETTALALAAAGGDPRLSVIRLEKCGGPAAARNLAIKSSRSPLICVLDADDFFLPGRLSALLGQMDGFDFVADDLLRVYQGREDEPYERLMGDRLSEPLTLDFATFVDRNNGELCEPRRELGFLKPVMRRGFLRAAGLAYQEDLRLGEDFILYARALAAGARFKLVPACGYVAVERPGSLSHEHTAADLRALLGGARSLASDPAVDAAGRAALVRYLAALGRKLHYRDVLDARRSAGVVGAVRVLLGAPAHAPYVVRQTLSRSLRLLTPPRRPALP